MKFTHKQAIRNLLLVLFIITLLLCLGLAFVISTEASFEGFLIGISFGIVAGALYSWFVSRIWDPVTLQSTPESGSYGCWMTAVAVGGILAGRLISDAFGANFVGWFAGAGIGVLYTVTGYLLVQVWCHRPKE